MNYMELNDWDELVEKSYGRPYCLQQQDGCMSRQTIRLTVPDESEDYDNDTVPEIVNHEDMGVSLAAWLARDPKAPLADGRSDYGIKLWWHRNFYPELQTLANHMHANGSLAAGDYSIIIDW